MTVNMETAISFLKTKVGKVRYSMYGSRNFSDGTCDCSGAVYTALRKGGASDAGYILSTETLHSWLIKNGFKLIAENKSWAMKRGDVVIWGRKGQSAGAGGHTGICIDGQNWLECTAWKSLGETQQNHDARWSMNGGPYFYVYRLNSSAPNKLSTSGWIKERGTFTVTVSDGIVMRSGSASVKSPKLAVLKKGNTVKYDAFCYAGGYVWIRQPRSGGKYGYLPTGDAVGNKRKNYWGKFK